MSSYEYDVALSFAGEDRSHAEALALALTSRKIRVFYDRLEQHDLWGKDLIEYLHEVYSRKARYCIFLTSKHYASKGYPRHEKRSALERAFRQETEYLLPIRIDGTELPGLPETTGYVRLEDFTIDQLADLVVKKLGAPLSDTAPVETSSEAPSPEKMDIDPIGKNGTVL